MTREDRKTAIYVAFEEDEPIDFTKAEKRLLHAILETAMSDLRKPGRFAQRAREYLLNSDENYIFSFRSICNFLEVDANRILEHAGIASHPSGRGYSLPK